METILSIAVTILITVGMSIMLYLQAEIENRRERMWHDFARNVVTKIIALKDESEATREMVEMILDMEEVKNNRMPIEMTEVKQDETLG